MNCDQANIVISLINRDVLMVASLSELTAVTTLAALVVKVSKTHLSM